MKKLYILVFFATLALGPGFASAPHAFADSTKNFTINFAGTGGGSVILSDTSHSSDSATVTTTSVVPVGNNDKGTLTATSNASSTFTGWSSQSGGVTGCVGNSCNFDMSNSLQHVTATFTKITKTNPTLSITNSPVTYNGSAQSATVTGSVAGTASNVQYNGSTTVPTNAGTYIITANFTPTDTTDYNSLTNASTTNNFIINKATATISVAPYSVTYDGNSHTAIGTSTGASGANLNASLNLSGTTHVNAGSYPTDAWSFTGGANYNDASGTVADNIGKATLTITPNDISKTYGDVVTFAGTEFTSGDLASGDGITSITLSSTGAVANAPVSGSPYDIIGSAAIGTGLSNYDIHYNAGKLTVSARAVTVTADAKGKDYGSSDPLLTYQITSGSLVSGDSFSGALTRSAGEDVGTYSINQDSLALDSNYNLTYIGANFVIGQNTLTISADPQTKVYGTADPALTSEITNGSLAEGDSLSGSLARVSGESVATYAITQGSLTAGDNYNISFTGNNFSITPVSITVTADPQTKVYGTSDPVFTYQVTGGALVGEDTLSGSQDRVSGENVGTYAINQGTLDNSNYSITYNSAELTITKADQTITFDPLGAKTFGDPDFPVSATSSSGLSVTFTNGEGACTISDGTVHLTSTGICTITAHQDGDGNYNSAEDVTQSFTVATLTHKITASAGDHGTITPSGDVSVADGEDQSFTIAAADNGSSIVDVVVDDVSVGATTTYTFTDVTTDHTISASFLAPHGGGLTLGEVLPPPSTPTGQVLGTSTQAEATTSSEGKVLGASIQCGPYINSYMALGANNDPIDVKNLQKFLNNMFGLHIPVTGFFGRLTEAGVKQFQIKYSETVLKPWVVLGLASDTTPTGDVYKLTKWQINMLECPDLDLPVPTLP